MTSSQTADTTSPADPAQAAAIAADPLQPKSVDLHLELARSKQQFRRLSAVFEELRERAAALTAHEHYTVVVTNVRRNGRLIAEVAGLGSTRVQVVVAPEVDPESLVVGAMGLVSRDRNCLLQVTSGTSRWGDVGTFEKQLDAPGRILLRDRETFQALDVADALRDTKLHKGDLVGYDRDVGLAYERLEMPAGDHLFDENVTDDFAQLGGLETLIARLKRHLDFRFRHPDLAAKYALKSKCGLLLSGVPGNGKTRLARCCAGYVRELFPDMPCRFMHVAGSSDYNKWFGETEQRIIERFDAVRAAAQQGLVVMFWDEVDAIARRRGTDAGSGAPDRVLNTFLSQIDGIVPLGNVFLLYATNRADTLDPGFLRPGRTDEKIEVPPPDSRTAAAILECYLGRGLPLADGCTAMELASPIVSQLFAHHGDYAVVAQVKLSDGRQLPVAGRQLLSGAMLENVVHVAAQQAAAREMETGREGVNEEDLAQALETELVSAVSLLAPGNIKSYAPSIPQDAAPIAVDAVLTSSSSTYLRRR